LKLKQHGTFAGWAVQQSRIFDVKGFPRCSSDTELKEDLHSRTSGVEALKDVTFNLEKGELSRFMGPKWFRKEAHFFIWLADSIDQRGCVKLAMKQLKFDDTAVTFSKTKAWFYFQF